METSVLGRPIGLHRWSEMSGEEMGRTRRRQLRSLREAPGATTRWSDKATAANLKRAAEAGNATSACLPWF